MAACATNTTKPTISEDNDLRIFYCTVARPIIYDSRKIEPELTSQIKEHNAVFDSICQSLGIEYSYNLTKEDKKYIAEKKGIISDKDIFKIIVGGKCEEQNDTLTCFHHEAEFSNVGVFKNGKLVRWYRKSMPIEEMKK